MVVSRCGATLLQVTGSGYHVPAAMPLPLHAFDAVLRVLLLLSHVFPLFRDLPLKSEAVFIFIFIFQAVLFSFPLIFCALPERVAFPRENSSSSLITLSVDFRPVLLLCDTTEPHIRLYDGCCVHGIKVGSKLSWMHSKEAGLIITQ